MEETDSDCSAGDSGDAAVHRHRRRNRAVPVELAAAVALRLARDQLLAGAWDSGAVPDPLRRIGMAWFRSLQCPPSHGRALRAHDPRGAGAVPAADARAVWLRPIHQREPGAVKLASVPVARGPARRVLQRLRLQTSARSG